MAFEIYQFPYGLQANYGVLVHDPESGQTACVDAGDAADILAAARQRGWTIDQLWVTHHHHDHVGGLSVIKKETGCHVLGPVGIAGIDTVLAGGNSFAFCSRKVEVWHTPGHTLDMLNYHIPEEELFFAGDTLFVMGCGRVFEGTMEQMHESLQSLKALPDDTVIYCSHEYTLANAEFCASQAPRDKAVTDRLVEIRALRDSSKATVPTSLARELETNLFLRAASADEFARLRAAKDNA